MSKELRQRKLWDTPDTAHEGSSQLPVGAAESSGQGGDAESGGAAETASQPDLHGKTVYAIDAHALIYQVFFAMPDMSGPQGQPVGALHGFTRDVLDILDRKRPDYLFCAFDHSAETFRHELYQEYKVHREEMPGDLRLQMGDIRRMMAALGVPVLEVPGYEADDVLATLARVAEANGGDCFLVTNDKDCRQLITPHVRLYNIRKDQTYAAEQLQDDWGIRPDQVVDFQSLVGDAVDNVPGVPLIGPKIAAELLQRFGSMEAILEHAREVNGKKRRENLVAHRDQALLSRQLVRLVDDVPVAIDWTAGHAEGMGGEAAEALCREFGFRRLAERMARLAGASSPQETVSNSASHPVPQAGSPHDAGPGGRQPDSAYRLIGSLEELEQVVERMRAQDRLALTTLASRSHPRWAELIGFAFCWAGAPACYLPLGAPVGDVQLDASLVLPRLRPMLEDPAIGKFGHNVKFDRVLLQSRGIQLAGVRSDTMVADYLLQPGQRSHTLEDVARRYLQCAPASLSELLGKGRQGQQPDALPTTEVLPWAAERADLVWRLSDLLQRQLVTEGLAELYDNLELPLTEVLAEMEFLGIQVDVARLDELERRFADRLEQLQQDIYRLAGKPFSIDSRRQLANVLFVELGLPEVKKTKSRSGPSVDAEVLGELARSHELPRKILQYRHYAKLKSTYVDALRELVHPQSGRVYTSFKQDVAATGRLSSTEPNLQNIPVRTEEGRQIRSAFLAGPPGWKLMAADYSQIELRVLAHFSGDRTLQAAFAADEDVHALVASEVYHVPRDQVSQQMRRHAKAINFGVIYGQSPFGLAKSLGIETAEAAKFIDAYFARYPGVDEFIVNTLEECRRKGYVRTILNRRRAVQGIRSPSRRGDSRQRNLPERIAINTVIQGSAADLIKQAMIGVRGQLRQHALRARMLLQIHDELLFEVPPEELDELSVLVREQMGAVGDLAVPLKVDVQVGDNWAACQPLR